MSAPRYRWQPTTRDIAERLGIPRSRIVRFDHNTSPFPTDWAIPLAEETAARLNEYPGANYRPLREAAARYLGVEATNVVPGAGVDELILLVARAFLGPGRRSVAMSPTYPLYRIAAAQVGADHVDVPADDGLATPVDALAAAARDADVLWLCVPNNPTGERIPDEAVLRLVDAAGGLTFLDAAYAEIAGDRWSHLVARDDVLVAHTLSKGFGLAGLRVGFAAGAPDLVDALDGVRPPGSIAEPAAVIAEAALDDPSRMERNVARLVAERDRLAAALEDLGFDVHPSTANFLLCR
ncbi:MAG TPA: aminotransferase class I/II-fold pyridoxal phosphate-dependent enzyme, partial [Actinobacteria bacterium]|nr:aminotransferase class I/II-fold pyridoxal phosphate-dependent enzyme [Actinomycetota bacterium]